MAPEPIRQRDRTEYLTGGRPASAARSPNPFRRDFHVRTRSRRQARHPCGRHRASIEPRGLRREHEQLARRQHQCPREKETVTVTGSGESFMVNGMPTVVCGNVQTANATVYIIDSVLLPKS
jgi:Fasciclin domain